MYGDLQRRKVKRCIYQNKKGVNEHFRRTMNQDVSGNRKRGKGEELQKNKGCMMYEAGIKRG